MKIGVTDDHFAFELARNLGFTYYGSSDLGAARRGVVLERLA